MARSKSKSRPSQKASAKPKQSPELLAEGASASTEFTRQPAQVNTDTRSSRNDNCLSFKTNSTGDAVGLLELLSNPVDMSESSCSPVAECEQAETTKTPSDDFEFLLKHEEIEAALERVDLWMSEASGQPDNLEQLATHLETKMDCEVSDELNLILPDYRLESQRAAEAGEVRDSQLVSCHSNQLIVGESEEIALNRASSSSEDTGTLDVDSVCQRLEATASAIEDRLEQLWTGFESNLNSRFSKMLHALDRLPQQLVETQVDLKSSSREANPIAKSAAAPAEASWETRKRQMLSEFGMTHDEIEQMVPDQKHAKSANENSKKAPNIESVALEALHTSLETLDKIDSGIRSEEIDRLKEQLTSQLREAEVELSINRAKLCKEWATLEQRATELSQRESALKSKYNDAESSAKHGLLDRITRHLSRRS